MDDLMKCLFEFTFTERMTGLDDDEEYNAAVCCIDQQEDRVRAYLDKEQRKELHRLIDAVMTRESIVHEHLFQAALELAKELNALVRA